VDAAHVEIVRALCDDLASISGVIYAACERRGASNIGEAGDRSSLLSGPVTSTLREELVPVTTELVFRVIYDDRAKATQVQASVDGARTTLLRLLKRSLPDWVPPHGTPPTGGGGGAAAQAGLASARRTRLN
jgi:hypothetical protein